MIWSAWTRPVDQICAAWAFLKHFNAIIRQAVQSIQEDRASVSVSIIQIFHYSVTSN